MIRDWIKNSLPVRSQINQTLESWNKLLHKPKQVKLTPKEAPTSESDSHSMEDTTAADDSDVDSHGNLKDLIDYNYESKV